MDIQRTISVVIEPDKDLEHTLEAVQKVQRTLSEPCFNEGKPLGALALQRLMYHEVKGSLSAQMTISAIRTVCAAYQSAKSNKKPAKHPFLFRRARALFLIGKRGRDADFRKDGTLSVWTVSGRKRLHYSITCPHCGSTQHAAINIRNRYTLLRESGDPSMSPEAQTVEVVGKPLSSNMGYLT